MLEIFVLSIVIFAVAMVGLSIGLIVRNRGIKGSCCGGKDQHGKVRDPNCCSSLPGEDRRVQRVSLNISAKHASEND